MKEPTVARVYAEALFDSAEKLGQTEEVAEGNKWVREVFDANPKLMRFLCTPHIVAADKKNVIRAIFSDKVPDVLRRFLCLLLDKRRIEELSDIIEEYEMVRDERLGIEEVNVISATPLDDETVSALIHKLQKLTGNTINVRVTLQPDIIGGLIVQMKDIFIDGSVRRQLDDIAKLLRAARVY